MSDSVLRRLRYTPARDLVRGRISGRLDVTRTIEASRLPPEAREIVRRVVKRTRLWLLEKVEVADELIAHFADGIEAGSSVQTLIDKFGDERKAARLIRRAKKRNRPLPWHILRALGWMLTAMLVIYGFMAARFWLGRPSPKVDYLAALNRANLAVPEDDRAWPIYRKAILGMGGRLDLKAHEDELNAVFDARPGTEHWPKVGPWLAQHAQVLELMRQAATRQRLGFIYGPGGSMRDEELWPAKATGHWYAQSPNEGAVVAVLLPHLNDLRELANLLATDARFARDQKDAARVLTDVEALLKLSEQMHRDSGFLVVDLVALGIREVGLHAAEEALLDDALKLSDADLQKLAHLMSRPKLASDLFDFSGERMMLLDLIQRCYTDDGDSAGRLTMEGQRFLQQISASPKPVSTGYGVVLFDCFTVATGPLAESRSTISRKLERMMDIADANLRRPLRDANWTEYDRGTYGRDQMERIREPLLNLASPLNFSQQAAERSLGHRDGIVVGIALELYRRTRGQYPTTLGKLVPRYLPTVPVDRITGNEVKYKLAAGKPLIYSVGADQDDDGGRLPRGTNSWFKSAQWSTPKETAIDGDWVLFPQSGGD